MNIRIIDKNKEFGFFTCKLDSSILPEVGNIINYPKQSFIITKRKLFESYLEITVILGNRFFT